jgi:hypothetical protein
MVTEEERRQILLEARLRSYPAQLRFWSKVNKDGPVPIHRPELGPCYIWTGAVDGNGYAKAAFKLEGVPVFLKGSRVAFFFVAGRWPDPNALHRCDTRRCVRFTHLFEGTNAENSEDMVRKERSSRGEGRPASKLTDEQVRQIRTMPGTQRAIAEVFGVSQSVVSLIRQGKLWTHVADG